MLSEYDKRFNTPYSATEAGVIFGTLAQVKAGIRELADAGIEYLILNIPLKKEEAMIKQFAEEIIPSFS